MTDRTDVLVVGAGPNGLAAAAHLRAAGVGVRVVGETMGSWIHDMPDGMLLRSSPRSSNIAAPGRSHGLPEFMAESGQRIGRPIPIADYVAYGTWFQRALAPDAEQRQVLHIGRNGRSFVADLQDGGRIEAGRVVVAAGITRFAWRPPRFDGLPPDLVSHSFDHSGFAGFRGRRVVVVGSGPSALESAALLAESGADVELVARRPAIHWVPEEPEPGSRWRQMRARVASPPTDVGPPLISWAAAAPAALRWSPELVRQEVARRCLLPTGHGWLRRRLEGNVKISLSTVVVGASAVNGGLRLVLGDGRVEPADHLLCATGYRVDVTRYPFIDRELTDTLRLDRGYPVLGAGLESSVPGLHFVGAPAAATFGPIMRFVVGSWFSAPALTARVTGRRGPLLGLSF
jgi:FAD-dependent urate hydroxylase